MTNSDFQQHVLDSVQKVFDLMLKQDPTLNKEQAWEVAKKLVFRSYDAIIEEATQ